MSVKRVALETKAPFAHHLGTLAARDDLEPRSVMAKWNLFRVNVDFPEPLSLIRWLQPQTPLPVQARKP